MSANVDPENEYQLVMPFVVTSDAGGPYDSHAFVAGANFGALDTELKILTAFRAIPQPRYLETPLLPQIDLLAMKHGLVIQKTPWDEHPEEWTRIDFAYAEEDSDVR